MVDAINTAQAERSAARAELDDAPGNTTVTAAEASQLASSGWLVVRVLEHEDLFQAARRIKRLVQDRQTCGKVVRISQRDLSLHATDQAKQGTVTNYVKKPRRSEG